MTFGMRYKRVPTKIDLIFTKNKGPKSGFQSPVNDVVSLTCPPEFGRCPGSPGRVCRPAPANGRTGRSRDSGDRCPAWHHCPPSDCGRRPHRQVPSDRHTGSCPWPHGTWGQAGRSSLSGPVRQAHRQLLMATRHLGTGRDAAHCQVPSDRHTGSCPVPMATRHLGTGRDAAHCQVLSDRHTGSCPWPHGTWRQAGTQLTVRSCQTGTQAAAHGHTAPGDKRERSSLSGPVRQAHGLQVHGRQGHASPTYGL